MTAPQGTVPVLQSARLTLRPLHLKDAANITRALQNWEVTRWLTGPPWPFALRDAEAFVCISKDKAGVWAITLNDDAMQRLIGVIGLEPHLGYWLAPEKHGQGLMSEAVLTVLHWHFIQSEEPVISGHFNGNAASRAVLLNAGFSDGAIIQEFSRPLGKEVALQRLQLSALDWEKRHG